MRKKIRAAQWPVKLAGLLAIALLVPYAHASVLNNGNSVLPRPAGPWGDADGLDYWRDDFDTDIH